MVYRDVKVIKGRIKLLFEIFVEFKNSKNVLLKNLKDIVEYSWKRVIKYKNIYD